MGNTLTVLGDQVEEKVIQDLNAIAKEIHGVSTSLSNVVQPLLEDGWTGKAAVEFNSVMVERVFKEVVVYETEVTLLAVALRTALDAISQADELALVKTGEFYDAVAAVKDFENL